MIFSAGQIIAPLNEGNDAACHLKSGTMHAFSFPMVRVYNNFGMRPVIAAFVTAR